MSETITAEGTSQGAKKGWEVRMHSNQSGMGTFTTLHLEHAESREDAYAQAAKKGKGTAFPWVGSAKLKKETAKASAPNAADVVRAAGTSEGAKKGWEARHQASSNNWKDYSQEEAALASNSSDESLAHRVVYHHRHYGGRENGLKNAALQELIHRGKASLDEGYSLAEKHEEKIKNRTAKASESDPNIAPATEVIHCRSHASAAGSVLAEDSIGAFPLIYKPA